MFGESFLAAPVVDEGSTDWAVYLPAYKNIPGPQWMDVGSTFQVWNQVVSLSAINYSQFSYNLFFIDCYTV